MTIVGPRTQTVVPVIYAFNDRAFAGTGDMNGPVAGTLRSRQDTVQSGACGVPGRSTVDMHCPTVHIRRKRKNEAESRTLGARRSICTKANQHAR
jgi:hypothetical protein